MVFAKTPSVFLYEPFWNISKIMTRAKIMTNCEANEMNPKSETTAKAAPQNLQKIHMVCMGKIGGGVEVVRLHLGKIRGMEYGEITSHLHKNQTLHISLPRWILPTRITTR